MPEDHDAANIPGRGTEVTLTQSVPSRTPGTADDADRAEPTLAPSEHAHGTGSGTPAAARSVRRATARRASKRRAAARSHQSDTDASILDYLTEHPGSTSGDLAKHLNLDPGSVSPRLIQLAKTGEIKKEPHGYSIEEADEPSPPSAH